MAFYCSDCATWQASNYAKNAYHNGRLVVHKYCDYDRKYRAADQQIFGCRGFVWVRRAVITKVCDILKANPERYFNAFDDTKEIYLVPDKIDKLIDYNSVGPNIAEKMENDPNNRIVAEYMLNNYIMPATVKGEDKDYQGAVEIYERMIKTLAAMYHEMKENILDSNIDYGNLINISISKSF